MKAAENPFRSSAIAEVRYRIEEAELVGLAARAASAPFRQCCLLGPEGSGKTTLLEDLEPYLQAVGFEPHWLSLQEDAGRKERRRALARMKHYLETDICLLDGGEVLSWWQWRSVLGLSRRQGFRLIVTLHRERGLPVLRKHETSWELARELVARLAGDRHSPALEETARRACEETGGNVREVFRACYFHCAED